MTAPLPPPAPSDADAEPLARLMLDAYAGTIDNAGDETIETARVEVAKLVRGDFGPFDAASSVVVERDHALASATIITRDRGEPLLAFSMTAPRWKRQGLARAGLLHVMHGLHARGECRLHLVVTAGNTPAESLYRSLGFVVGAPPVR
jgi:ribosomal protein S18 acetylase RimI-like enzyme